MSVAPFGAIDCSEVSSRGVLCAECDEPIKWGYGRFIDTDEEGTPVLDIVCGQCKAKARSVAD